MSIDPLIPLPARSSVGGALHAGRIYYVAGHVGPFHIYPAENFAYAAHVFDCSANEWREIASFPSLAQGFRLVGYEDALYSFGGFVHTFDDTASNPVASSSAVYRYSLLKGEWSHFADLAKPRSSHVAGRVGSKVYLIGGWNGWAHPPATPRKGPPMWESGGTFHNTIGVFDLSKKQFQKPIKLGITARRAFASVVQKSKVIIAGGLGKKGFTDLFDEVRVFTPRTATWKSLPSLPEPRFSPALAATEDALYLIGGLYVSPDHKTYKEFSDILILRNGATSWQQTNMRLRSPRTFAEAFIIEESELIVFGGHSGTYPTNVVERFRL